MAQPSWRECGVLVILIIAGVFIAVEGKKRVEAEAAAQRAEEQARYEQNADRRQARSAAWKARQAGLTGPRLVYVPYQEPLPPFFRKPEPKEVKMPQLIVPATLNPAWVRTKYYGYFFEKQ